ncbi:hypothetical protein BHQ15_00565 [Mycolicibacillus koreensis]|nr:hypothetical protein BHQ15_00565 [Mycolicibacillus koreensis]
MSQQLLSRPPLVTAGIALAGAGVLTAAPVTPAVPDIEIPDIQLTALDDFDPISQLGSFFDLTSVNASQLINNFGLAPGVGLQQAIVNQFGFLGDILNDPASIGDVLGQLGTNVENVLTGTFLLGASDATAESVVFHTLSPSNLVDLLTGTAGHDLLYSAMTGALDPIFPAPDEPLPTLINLLSSPASGVLIGTAGPFISPIVPFLNPFMGLLSETMTPADAFEALLSAPLDSINGFFNGETLNLAPLIPLVGQLGLFPEGVEMTGLDFAFGGLLTPGVVGAGPWGEVAVPAAGGSILNGLGLDLTGLPPIVEGLTDLHVEGAGVGPIGALQGMSQTIAALLGASTWDGKGANAAIPPLAGLELPSLGDLFNFDSAMPAGLLSSLNLGDFSLLPTDLLSNLGGLGGDFGLLTLPQMLIEALLGAVGF